MTTLLDRAALAYGETRLGFQVECGSVKAIFRQLSEVLVCRHVEDIMDTRQGDDAVKIIWL